MDICEDCGGEIPDWDDLFDMERGFYCRCPDEIDYSSSETEEEQKQIMIRLIAIRSDEKYQNISQKESDIIVGKIVLSVTGERRKVSRD